jgi:general secretion pathway protein A
MYTAFYGLSEKPFALSPDPRFLYLAASHREALAHLLYGIEQGEGFISVTGEVGTGKTTLCRTLLERLGGDLELAFLFNPSHSALELIQSICAEFELPAEGLTRRSLMTQLNAFLVEQKRIGRRVLLIIDEAQTLSENTLEQVRLLSNLETSREKLIQILLLGQPELDRKLEDRGLRQLRQRISVRWQLDPLGPDETRAYVRHRLAVAAGEPKDLFSDAALREVHRRTGGIPRLVNQLCDRALLGGYAARAAQIGPRLIRAAAREIPDARLRTDLAVRADRRGFFIRPWMMIAATLAIVSLALVAGLSVGRNGLTNSMQASIFKAADLGGPGSESMDRPIGRIDLATGSPAVGANAPRTEDSRFVDPPDGPPVAELIGSVPSALRKKLRPSASQLDPSGLGAQMTSSSGEASPSQLPETALATGLLAEFLASRDQRVALAESRGAILERFGRRVVAMSQAPTDAGALERSLRSRGLTTTTFEGGSIDLLSRLDHPVALPLSVSPSLRGSDLAASEERWIAITGFKNGRARVAGLVSGRLVTIEVAELERHWLERGVIVWEQFEPIPSILISDDEGAGVLWLQRALAELQLYEDVPTGRYDGATAEAVMKFQQERGLVADGVAGPFTQIALYAELRRYPVPRLSQYSRVGAEIRVDTSTSTGTVPMPPTTSATRASGERG